MTFFKIPSKKQVLGYCIMVFGLLMIYYLRQNNISGTLGYIAIIIAIIGFATFFDPEVEVDSDG